MLVDIARQSIKSVFSNYNFEPDETIKKKYSKDQGAFVTLTEDGQLRGCIGYIEPIMPLWKAVSQVAIAAAFRDIRFAPIKQEDLDKICVEVSVLSVPEIIKVKDSKEYIEKIKIGRDGLIIESDRGKGVLLPQVPEEWGWDVVEYLENLCQKAGISPDAWKDLDNKIFAFHATIYSEESPNGPVVEK